MIFSIEAVDMMNRRDAKDKNTLVTTIKTKLIQKRYTWAWEESV